jgi:hypothetical protein
MTAGAGDEHVDRHDSDGGPPVPQLGGGAARASPHEIGSVPVSRQTPARRPGRPGAPAAPRGTGADTGAGCPPGPLRPGPPGPPARPDQPESRPPVVDELAVLGFSRHLRSRLGTRLFTWFFVLVFALILVQLISSLLDP